MSRVVEIARSLIEIPSYSGQEAGVRDYISNFFETEGIQTIRQGENLLAHLQGRDRTRAFIFNSHMDVVSTGDPKDWTHAPFSANIADGNLYGRGAADMKSGMAGSIETALQLAKRQSLPTDIWFTYVVNEEVDGSGTEAFANWFKLNNAKNYLQMTGIFTEPTGLTTVENGHKGNFFIDATVKGNTGHSSRPREIKVNAPERLAKFIYSLADLNRKWFRSFDGGEFTPPTVTVTSINTETASYNKVASNAAAHLDLRTIRGYHEEAYQTLQAQAETYGVDLALAYPAAPWGYTSPDARIILAMKSIIPGLNLEVSEGSADLGFVTGIGVEGVIFGPGDKSQAHQTNEYAPVDQIENAPGLFINIYDAWSRMK
jgi:succinyl-diaminopimelate desuccinylase